MIVVRVKSLVDQRPTLAVSGPSAYGSNLRPIPAIRRPPSGRYTGVIAGTLLPEQKRERDLKCLSDIELDALIYLTAKMYGADDVSSDVVGVIPIYAEGKSLHPVALKEIENCLGAYGVRNHQLPMLSLGRAAKEDDE